MGRHERQEEWGLLRAAESAGYEVLVTVDQALPRQQNLTGRTLSIIVIRVQTNQIEDLLPLVDVILDALETIQPGQTVTLPSAS